MTVKVLLKFPGKLQPGLILNVGVGVHQNVCLCVAGIALYGLDVTPGHLQLIGGAAATLDSLLSPWHTAPFQNSAIGQTMLQPDEIQFQL